MTRRGVLILFSLTVAVLKSILLLALNVFLLFSPLLVDITVIMLVFILSFCRVPEFEYSKPYC
jgi:hypothetical protein